MKRLVSLLYWPLNRVKTLAEKYEVKLWLFALLYFGTWPPFAYAIYRSGIAVHARQNQQAVTWMLVAFLSFVLPYGYVIWSGKDIARKVRFIACGILFIIGAAMVWWKILG